MPRTVILTAHTVDYQAVRVHLTELEEETHPQGTVYEVGQFSVNGQTWEVAIAEIDNSNASAASEAERAISHFKPDVILLVGAATGIKDVALGDVIVATKVYGYESGRAEDEFRPQPEVQQPSYQLRERAKAERRKADWLKRLLSRTSSSSPSVLLAPITSGEKEVANRQAALLAFLRSQYSDAVAVENLGFGFLQAVHANEAVFALTVHSISNLIDSNAETTQVGSRAIALQNVSAFTFEILAKYKIGDAGATQRIRGIVSYGMTPDELSYLLELDSELKQQLAVNQSALLTNAISVLTMHEH